MPGREAKPLEYSPNGVLYLGSYLRSVRQARGWRLADVAAQAGCTLSGLSNIETNKVPPSARLVATLARVLDIPPADLAACPTPPAVRQPPPRRVAPADAHINGTGGPPTASPAAVGMPAAPVWQPHADAAPERAAADAWSLGQQVEAVIASFQLAPTEAAFAGALVVELTRSLCLQLKDRRLPRAVG